MKIKKEENMRVDIEKTIFYDMFIKLLKKYIKDTSNTKKLSDTPIALALADHDTEPITAFICFGIINKNKREIIKKIFLKEGGLKTGIHISD